MNWKDIQVSDDNTHFVFDGKPIFDKTFIEVLKFHSPGLAPVKDNSGAYHIDSKRKRTILKSLFTDIWFLLQSCFCY
jgi:hypothetical protein